MTAKGFVFMDTPGYDPVRHGPVRRGRMRCFTTGAARLWLQAGSFIKLATNTDVYNRMIEDMDINCGDVVEGVSIADKGQEIFNKVLKVASGETTKSEELGYGDNEYVPWQVGAVM